MRVDKFGPWDIHRMRADPETFIDILGPVFVPMPFNSSMSSHWSSTPSSSSFSLAWVYSPPTPGARLALYTTMQGCAGGQAETAGPAERDQPRRDKGQLTGTKLAK